MAFGGRSPAGGGEGVELARGYISLTAKYSPAMQAIANDFKALEAEADKAGVAAGAKLKAGITGGAVPLGTHLRSEFAKAGRVMTSDAEAYGAVIGGALGRGISAPFRAVDRVVGNLGSSIKETVTGPMAKMVGGATVLGVAFETMSKGWELDVKIDKTRTQLEGLGASVQDIQEFMKDVQEATKGTSNSFSDVADAAKDLFAEGRRGNQLVEELKTVQNMAAIAGKDVESLWGTFEKAHGRDAINPMVLGSLQMQGLPAREELAKALNLKGTADEINAALNKALKAKSGGPTWDVLFQQFAKDFPDAAARFSKSLEGQTKMLQTNLGKVGGDFIKGALGGGTGGLEGINSQLDKLDGWVNAHQNEIHHFFEDVSNTVKDVFGALKYVVDLLKDDFPGGIKGVVVAFGAWKTISAIADMTRDLKVISGIFSSMPGEAAAAGTGAAAGLAPLSAVIVGITGGLAAVAAFLKVMGDKGYQHGMTQPLSGVASDLGIPNVPTPAGPPVLSPSGVVPPSRTSAPTPAPGDIPGLLLPSHAKGAVIQPSVHPNGIVQWAEPSTGGEAYIPLGLSNRSRSVEIWKETGRRLRAFSGGGFDGPGYGWAPNVTNPERNSVRKPDHDRWVGGGFQRVPGGVMHPEWGEGIGVPWGKRYAFDKGGITGPDGKKLKGQWVNDKSKGMDWNSPLGPLGWIVDWMSHDTGDVSGPGDFGTSTGSPTVGPNDENAIRSWVQQQFGIPNTKGTGSWENSAHNHDGGWHHRGMGGKDVGSGYAFDFHGTPAQMSQLANWVAQNYAKDTLELIYSGAGFDHNREIKNGRFGDVYGAGTNSQHTDHVHWAMTGMPGGGLNSAGGVVPVDISKVGGKGFDIKGAGGGSNPIEELAGIGKNAFTESLLPPGFTDYTKNPWVKSGGALLGMLGSQISGPGGDMLGLMGNMLGGGGGGKGTGIGGLGDMLSHPLRGALAESDPARAAALGWTQAGEGGGGRGHGPRVNPGQLAAGMGMAAPGHGGVVVNGSVMDHGSIDRLNKMQQDKKITDSRARHSSTASTQRIGQPGS